MHMAPMIDIVFLSVYNRLFERPSAVRTDEFQTVGVDTGVATLGDEFLAVSPERGTVEFVGSEGVAFLGDETFVVSAAGFVDTSDDRSGADVAAYEVSSVATVREKVDWVMALWVKARIVIRCAYHLQDILFESIESLVLSYLNSRQSTGSYQLWLYVKGVQPKEFGFCTRR